MQKTEFSNFFTLCCRNGSFECFFSKKGLGPLGVKTHLQKFDILSWSNISVKFKFIFLQ